MDEEDGHSVSYQKTKNEIVDANEIEKLAPKFDQERLDSLDSMEPFGSVIQYVSEGNGIILIMPSDSEKLYDLDNIICLPESVDKELDKLVVGFLSDVVGPVSMPLYTIQLYQSVKERLNLAEPAEFWKGRKVNVVTKTLKTINAKLPEIMSKKGCDASNAFDEECATLETGGEAYFSDDEKEREANRKKKQKKK